MAATSGSKRAERGQLIGFVVGFLVIVAIVGGAIWYVTRESADEASVFEDQDLNLDFLDE